MAQGIRDASRQQVAQSVDLLKHILQQNEPAITVAEAQRRHIGDVRDALKWAAAFSTAALLLTAQIFRSRGSAELLPLTEGLGLAIGSVGFLASIVGAGLFLVTVDLPMAEWLRLVATRVHLDLQAYRSAMEAYSDAGLALADGDDPSSASAIDRAGKYMDEVQARGDYPTPAPSLPRLQRIWLTLCLGGFGVGILAVLGDFAAKMSLVSH